jgi:hypothetical protein
MDIRRVANTPDSMNGRALLGLYSGIVCVRKNECLKTQRSHPLGNGAAKTSRGTPSNDVTFQYTKINCENYPAFSNKHGDRSRRSTMSLVISRSRTFLLLGR